MLVGNWHRETEGFDVLVSVLVSVLSLLNIVERPIQDNHDPAGCGRARRRAQAAQTGEPSQMEIHPRIWGLGSDDCSMWPLKMDQCLDRI